MRLRTRRLVAVGATAGLLVASGFALPTTLARLGGTVEAGVNTVTVGDWREDPAGGLADLALGVLCAADALAPHCPQEAPDVPVPPWLTERAGDAPVGDPEPEPTPEPTPSGEPTAAPGPGEHGERDEEDCAEEACVEAAIRVVDEFVGTLERDEEAPVEAVRTMREFVDEVAASAPREDVPLTEDAQEALDALVAEELLPPPPPACVLTVGALATHLEEVAAAAGDPAVDDPAAEGEPSTERSGEPPEEPSEEPTPCPEPSPRASTARGGQEPARVQDDEPRERTRTSSPSPSPSPTPRDEDGDGEPDPTYDKPGVSYEEYRESRSRRR